MKQFLGVDLGGTNIAVGLVNEEGQILHQESIPTRAERTDVEIVKDIANLCKKIIEETGSNPEWIGIGAPGSMDSKNGVIIYSNNINMSNTPVRKIIQEVIDLPVYLGNDADCAALGEAYGGATKGVDNSVMITLGTGVGGGIIIDKRIYSGFNFCAGELGHTVIVVDGEPCSCGRKGCWEAYSSATALIRMTREEAEKNPDGMIYKTVDGDLDKINGKVAWDCMFAGDEGGKRVIDRYLKYLSEGLANIINIFQPEVLVIGGGVSNQKDNLVKPLNELISKLRYSREGIPQTIIKVAELG
ncbi:MAG: ROK family protein, partial [Eubacteriales bacterium]|nr:ROK family protein [Eubacteriales bacterium]